MILSYKVRIHPTKTQIIEIEKMLRACSLSYRVTLRECTDRITKGGNGVELPSAYSVQASLTSDPNLSLIANVDKHAMKDASIAAIKYAKKNVRHKYGEFVFTFSAFDETSSSETEEPLELAPKGECGVQAHTKSFRLDPPRSKKWIKKRHLKLTYLGKVKCKHTDRIPQSGKVVSIIIKKEFDKYFCIVRVEHDSKCLLEMGKRNDLPKNRMAISLSTDDDHFLVFKSPTLGTRGMTFEVTKERYKRCMEHVKHLEETRNRILTTSGGLASKHIEQLDSRINCETEHARNIMRNYIDNVIKTITNSTTYAIVMESFTVNYYDKLSPGRKKYHELIAEREWEYFIKRLKSAANTNLIDLYVPVDTGATHYICSNCKRVNKFVSAEDPVFSCRYCNNTILKAINTANNLYDCTDLFDVVFDDISKERRKLNQNRKKN